MKLRNILVFGVALMVANPAQAASKYARTLDGKTLIWRDNAQRRFQASWSGDRDDNGYAAGRGPITWYQIRRTWETGTLLPSTKYIPVSRYTGKMVEGKLEGTVVTEDTTGKSYRAKFADGQKTSDWVAGTSSASKKRTAHAVSEAKPSGTPAEVPPAAPRTEQRVAENPPEASPAASQPPPSTPEVSASPADSVQSLAMPPSSLRVADLKEPSAQASPPAEKTNASDTTEKSDQAAAPPPSVSTGAGPTNDDDARTVAALDSEFHAAMKTNDAATIDRIVADDFMLVRGFGRSLNKSDLVKQAREKQAKYEHHDVEEGSKQVRVWRDTAVVTETVWVKGSENGKPVDQKLAVTATYARTPNGWRYVAGQAAVPPK